MSPLDGIYRSTRHGGQDTSPRDKEGYHGITSILNYHIWSCIIYSNSITYVLGHTRYFTDHVSIVDPQWLGVLVWV